MPVLDILHASVQYKNIGKHLLLNNGMMTFSVR